MKMVPGCCALLLILSAKLVTATVCDCRPEFETESEGSGVCSKIKDDKRWCKTKFGTAATRPGDQRSQEFTARLKTLGLPPVDPVKAVQEVAKPPEEWTTTTVTESLTTVFTIALWDTAPDRLKEAVDLIRKEAGRVLDAAKSEGRRFHSGRYDIGASRGCVQLTEGSFSTMVRTPSAKPFDAKNTERSCAP